MFEKEAEDNKPPYAHCSLVTDCKLWEDGFQKGAEFGYNKANEWHKIADGDLPKEPRTVLVFTKEFGVDMDIWTGHTFDQSVTKVIAWKEIVLPKEIKEK